MPLINDSRSPGTDLGFLVGQDHRNLAPDARCSLIFTRVIDRGRYGHYTPEEATTGDFLPLLLWPQSTREIPAWGNVFAATVQVGGAAGRTVTARDAPRGAAVGKSLGTAGQRNREEDVVNTVLPVRDLDGTADERFAKIQIASPEGFPDYPGGYQGIVVAATEETEQRELFHPTDPRLVLPHVGGKASMSSVAADCKDDDLDPDRHGRLTSALRVIAKPTNAPEKRNAIGLNLTRSGRGDVRGGYVFDTDTTRRQRNRGKDPRFPTTPTSRERETLLPSGEPRETSAGAQLQKLLRDRQLNARVGARTGTGFTRSAPTTFGPFIVPNGAVRPGSGRDGSGGGTGTNVVAMLSINDGGFVDVGGIDDQHRVGVTGDGEPINSAHISTDALFRNRFAKWEDGPLDFEPDWERGDDYDVKLAVHLAWNPDRERFGWWSSCPVGDSIPPPGQPPPPGPPTTPPGDIPPPDYPRPDPPPRTPTSEERARTRPTLPGGYEIPVDQPPPIPTGPNAPGAGGGGGGGGGGGPEPIDTPVHYVSRTRSRTLGDRHFSYVTSEFGSTAFLARPQRQRTGELDFRNTVRVGGFNNALWARQTPTTGRMEAYGAQGGEPGGPYLDDPVATSDRLGHDRWRYTERPYANAPHRSPGGTASGGWVVMPPEIDLTDIDAELEPSNVATSDTSLVFAPGARLAFGLPELAGGGVLAGFSLARSDVGTLRLSNHDKTTGAASQILLFGAAASTQVPNQSSGVTLDCAGVPDAAVATPPTGFATLYYDRVANAFKFKDDTGAVTTL